MFRVLNTVFLLMMCSRELYATNNNSSVQYNRFAPSSLIVNWINELPNYKDLKEYKEALNSVLYLFKDYRRDIDVSVAMGLHLIRVNFKHILDYMGSKLSSDDKAYIKSVISRADYLIQFFRINSANAQLKYVKISAVITATNLPWLERIKPYDMDLFKLNAERSVPWSWEQYKANINEVNNTLPSPTLSDKCLNALAEDMQSSSGFSQKCKLPKECMASLINGTNYGYALAHRILMLIFANLGRNCNVIAWNEDGKLMKRFCQLAKRECEYIAENKFGAPDLLMEFTALCSMDGYTQFMKRSWFHPLLKLQTVHGCFMETFDEPIPRASQKYGRKYTRGDRRQIGSCNKHTTVVASVTLAAAIRFILESYY